MQSQAKLSTLNMHVSSDTWKIVVMVHYNDNFHMNFATIKNILNIHEYCKETADKNQIYYNRNLKVIILTNNCPLNRIFSISIFQSKWSWVPELKIYVVIFHVMVLCFSLIGGCLNFSPEDGGSMFLNVGTSLTQKTTTERSCHLKSEWSC